MNIDKTTTRKQLQGYGATGYHAKVLTSNLTPVAKKGRAYTYSINDVIVSIRDYLQRPRIKQTTSIVLESILQALLERSGNVIEVPFSRGTVPEINKLARQLTQAMSKTDNALAEMKATAATVTR